MNKYIDIGVNLTGSSFNKDIPEVIERAAGAGVGQLIVTGTDSNHSEQAIRLSEQYESVCYATVGLHPHHASDYSNDLGSELREMLSHKKAVAVGECGLDFNRNFSTRQEQIRAFEAQLEIAIDLQKPLFLHQRDAHDDFVSIIKSCRRDLGQIVSHCFTGTAEEVNDYVSLDMHVGITGWISDERRGMSLQQAVKHIPLDRVMLETDAPYLLPRNLGIKAVKKGRNEPCYLPEISAVVSKFMGVGEDELCQAALKNTRQFFKI
ncbi:MAG: hydrolase TatD [Gammaproteobacteria bacterium]|nr:MAG: hydrolase TatD [Gammaproteobacteria bacterium]